MSLVSDEFRAKCDVIYNLTDLNDHSAALRESAKLIEDENVRRDFVRRFDAICLLVALDGHIDSNLSAYRNQWYNNLKNVLGKQLANNEYELWYNSL